MYTITEHVSKIHSTARLKSIMVLKIKLFKNKNSVILNKLHFWTIWAKHLFLSIFDLIIPLTESLKGGLRDQPVNILFNY